MPLKLSWELDAFPNTLFRQCVAVCCSVLQCDAASCNVLQCVADACPTGSLESVVLQAVCCSVLQCVTMCCSALQCVAVRCSALQCATVRCNELQCAAVYGSTWQCVTGNCNVCEGRTLGAHSRQCIPCSTVRNCVCSVMQRVAACCSVLQRVAVSQCSVTTLYADLPTNLKRVLVYSVLERVSRVAAHCSMS